MSLRNFDYFMKIVEYQNITKAAKSLFISQPSLSKYLRLLEKEVGTTLFYRNSPLELTAAGESYYQMAKNILAEEERFRQSVRRPAETKQETLHVGIPVWRNSLFVTDFNLLFAEKHPEIDLRVQELFGFETDDEKEVLNGIVDCCICNSDNMQDGLLYRTLCDENLLLTANREHPLIREFISCHEPEANGVYTGLELTALENEVFVCCESAQAQDRAALNSIRKSRIVPAKIIQTTAINTEVSFALKNRGMTFYPELGYTLGHPAPELAYFFLKKPPVIIRFCSVTTEKKVHSQAYKTYVRELSAYCRSHLLFSEQ